MKKLFAIILLGLGSAGAAFAGGMADPAPDVEVLAPAPPYTDWSGFYAGAAVGSGSGNMVYTPGPSWVIAPAASYGGFAGYNFQKGQLVYGGEIAVTKFNGFPGPFSTESFNYLADLKLRVGYAVDSVLLYAFAGGSVGSYSIPLAPATWSISGYNYGVGADLSLGTNLFAGVEYIAREVSGATFLPPQVQDNSIRTIQARLGWRF